MRDIKADGPIETVKVWGVPKVTLFNWGQDAYQKEAKILFNCLKGLGRGHVKRIEDEVSPSGRRA